MKISNETKVGILAVVAILALVIGFNFLKGSSLLSKEHVLYARFGNIGSLEKSNAVKINGYTVGKVYDFIEGDKEVNSIIVEIHLDRNISVPKNSLAIINASVLGAAYIGIEKGDANTYLASGDTISTRADKDMLANIQSQLAPTMTRVNETLDTLKMSLGTVNSIFDPNTKNNLRHTIENLALSTAYLQQLLNTQSGQLGQAMGNLNSVTGNLAKNNDVITSSLRNFEVTSSKLANANIEQIISALQGTVNELRATITKFNTNSGTLGLMMNDRQLYDQLNGVATRLNQTALSAEILLDDVRVNPKRYVNISVFGRKNKGDQLTSPALKDTIPVKVGD
jgi:phospholipid/cholesterol/gamma-HCH transport system substrate-binding protein